MTFRRSPPRKASPSMPRKERSGPSAQRLARQDDDEEDALQDVDGGVRSAAHHTPSAAGFGRELMILQVQVPPPQVSQLRL